jgi:hypothetical protein
VIALPSSPTARVSLEVPAGSELSSAGAAPHPHAAATTASANVFNNAVLVRMVSSSV